MALEKNQEKQEDIIRKILQEINEVTSTKVLEDAQNEIAKKGKNKLNKFIGLSLSYDLDVRDYIIKAYDLVGISYTNELIESLIGDCEVEERIKKINELKFNEDIKMKIENSLHLIKNWFIPMINDWKQNKKCQKVSRSTSKKVEDTISGNELDISVP